MSGFLVDYEIAHLVTGGYITSQRDEDLLQYVNPCSFDITLGSSLMYESPSAARWVDSVSIDQEPYILKPGELVLAHSDVYIKIPKHMKWDFVMKSSTARSGLNHQLAGLLDPGFEGTITLELTNDLRYHGLVLKAGMKIGQVVFYDLGKEPDTAIS